ncbi:MAG: VCBS repeat-containing protein [Chloroflexaceae bacterium]|nr:VCBS repeat-containing protein [Chloroflexaceae bacterium]
MLSSTDPGSGPRDDEEDATKSIAWGDLDGDTDLDLVVGNFNQPSRIYRNDSGTLTLAWSAPSAEPTQTIVLGDVDNDNDLDIVQGNYNPDDPPLPNKNLRVFTNNSTITTIDVAEGWTCDELSNPDEQCRESNPVYSLALGDIDNDDDLDLVSGNFSAINTLYTNVDGVFGNPGANWYTSEQDRTISTALADINGDGRVDLIVGNDQQPVRVSFNTHRILSASSVQSFGEDTSVSSLAWGDVDGDSDIDLVVGNANGHNKLFRNVNGTLVTTPVWYSDERDTTQSVAWGDADGDGDLDLAVGNDCRDTDNDCSPVRIYRNTGSGLSPQAVWSASGIGSARSVAWGDADGDGDLDLAVGNNGQPDQLYRNDSDASTIMLTPVWAADDSSNTYDVAWGDVDGDGDLDLAVATFCQGSQCRSTRLYRNEGGMLTTEPVWVSAEPDFNLDLAWGDTDSDGDLDLIVSNNLQPIRVYRNDGGNLSRTATWSSTQGNYTWAVALGDADNDGDLDLFAGNGRRPASFYANEHGSFTPMPRWLSAEWDTTLTAAWGDVDGDGDLDLAAARQCIYIEDGHPDNDDCPNTQTIRFYRNHRAVQSGVSPVPTVSFGVAGTAQPNAHQTDFYGSAHIWSEGTVPLTYRLAHPDSLPVQRIVGEYSLDGGGSWRPAVPTADTVTTNLSTSADGEMYTYGWDVFSSGVMGQSDNVVFRLTAIPDVQPRLNDVPGPYLYGAYAANTFPFRVRGSQVRVFTGTLPISNALVFQQPDSQLYGDPLADNTGKSFRTDDQGYVQGRAIINLGDRLVALVPISATNVYTVYATSAAPTPTGLDTYTVTQPGLQTLNVSADHPLILFNLKVSLEWDARADERFLTRLKYDIQRTSEILYDWTNGQVALGDVTVYHNRQHWNDAHIRVYATNKLRPTARQGGIVAQIIQDPLTPDIAYDPGQVRMGPDWNRYGDAHGTIGEDWPRTLAHELSHYLLYLNDNYIGLDDNQNLIPVDTCPGAMTDPYVDNQSEFHPDQGWLPGCAQTLSHRETQRSDWATIRMFYPWLFAPTGLFAQVNPGPSTLPLNLTHINVIDPPINIAAWAPPTLSIIAHDKPLRPGQRARVILIQESQGKVVDLGRPSGDEIFARGARPGDLVCVYDSEAQQSGCEIIQVDDQQLDLTTYTNWQPDLRITPETSRTIGISVTNIPSGLNLAARIYPANDPDDRAAPAAIALSESDNAYIGTFTLADPSFEGLVHIWVDEATPRRESIATYALGGNPGRQRSSRVPLRAPEGNPGRQRSSRAPLVGPGGQVILFGDLDFAEGQFFTFHTATYIPNALPWSTVVGEAYWLSASPDAPDMTSSSISFEYFQREVPEGEENFLRIAFWNGSTWEMLPTTLNTYYNMASAQTRGPGLYALMSSIEIDLENTGWNLFGYPVQATRLITEALQSIEGAYVSVYGYDASDTADPWKIYRPDVPDWVNDLQFLEFGKGYWIQTTRPITLFLRGNSTNTLAGTETAETQVALPDPPATFYGRVLPTATPEPAPGMHVVATIDTQQCGQATTREVDGEIVYVIDVLAAGPCGAPGKTITLTLDDTLVASDSIVWDNNQIRQYDLGTSPATMWRVYLAFVRR